MKKLKRIVVGIDINEKSDHVLTRALNLANEQKADLFVVHAVRTPWLAVPSYFGSKDIGIDTKGYYKEDREKVKNVEQRV